MQRVVPALRVKSYKEALAFYEKLGFSAQWTHQFGEDFPIFASIERQGMQLFLTEHNNDCPFGSLVHFYVDDVDSCHGEFIAKGVEVDEPPSNGLGPNIRDMLVVDPDGNRLSFLTVKN